MRVIYIAGAAHSGSTLLDLMLNAHPEIVSVGEVLKLNRQLGYRDPERKNYAPCSCGAPSLLQCKFWSAVDAETRAATGKSLAELDVLDSGMRDSGHAPNVALFKAIAVVSGKNLVVDSSKIPRRLDQLLQFPELDVYPVHLVRDPKGQIASVMRKHGGFLKNILRYEIVQEQIRRRLKSIPHSVIRYEDLVRDPERSLNSILQPLGLSFDRRQLDWAEADKHIVAGNHMRYQTTSSLVLDEKWRERLTARQQHIIDLGTTRSRRSVPPTGSIGGEP
jgi:sulfotransferase family protein